MAYILVDGYNLIGTAHRDLEKARKGLLEKLGKYSAAKHHDITVVFDGWKDGRATETRTKVSNITVIYSRIGDTADLVIKRMISEGGRPWIVVSSDREIADHAFHRGCAPVTSGEFEDRLEAAVTGSSLLPLSVDGRRDRLSKRQKVRLHALKKL